MKKFSKFNFLSQKKNKKNKLSSIILIFALVLLIIFFSKGFATLVDDSIEVQENTDLVYYLTISYDGVDKNGIHSDSTTISSINSGTILVKDKLPEGLIFKGFVTTSDGSIGAVNRLDGSPCAGKVVDDTNEETVDTGTWNDMYTEYTYHGLHFDSKTYTVSFKVKNLKAGCDLIVGIKTKTPMIDEAYTVLEETRRDFYNFATAREEDLTVNSNIVHVYMGKKFVPTHNVIYEYTGTVPENAPALPEAVGYVPRATVGVVAPVTLDDYTFSGWESDDVSVNSNWKTFTMPNSDVVFKGSFTKKETNTVKYSINGDMPSGYVLPKEKEYYPDSIVDVDSFETGTVLNGYRFLGWESTNVELSPEGDFEMPDDDVTFVGKFEQVTYNVFYQFQGSVIPSNSSNYLPLTKAYKPGENVVIEDVLSEPDGYKFLGWYKNDFVMPEEDVVIYGEWKERAGTFEPTIINEVISGDSVYKIDDTVRFKVTVTNTASFPIKNVIVKSNEVAKFENNANYTKLSDHIVNIDSLEANSSVFLYSTHEVSEDDHGIVENVVEIKGALADNSYELEDQDYVASDDFQIKSRLKLCKTVEGLYNANSFQFHITDSTNDYDTWVVLENNKCETLYLDPAIYYIKEIVPQEYKIKSVSGSITKNDSELVIESGKIYNITFTNEFVKKGFLHSFGRIVNKITQGDDIG